VPARAVEGVDDVAADAGDPLLEDVARRGVAELDATVELVAIVGRPEAEVVQAELRREDVPDEVSEPRRALVAGLEVGAVADVAGHELQAVVADDRPAVAAHRRVAGEAVAVHHRRTADALGGHELPGEPPP